MMNRLARLIVILFVALIVTADLAKTAQFLPLLINRRSSNRLDHHKLIKEINELDFFQGSTSRPSNPRAPLILEPVPTQTNGVTTKQSSNKREFSLDDFTLDDILSLNDDPTGQAAFLEDLLKQKIAAKAESTTHSSHCEKTRVAAGASGYLRLTCSEGLSSKKPVPPPSASNKPRPGLLQDIANAQYKRLNTDFNLLVDALASPEPATSRI